MEEEAGLNDRREGIPLQVTVFEMRHFVGEHKPEILSLMRLGRQKNRGPSMPDDHGGRDLIRPQQNGGAPKGRVVEEGP